MEEIIWIWIIICLKMSKMWEKTKCYITWFKDKITTITTTIIWWWITILIILIIISICKCIMENLKDKHNLRVSEMTIFMLMDNKICYFNLSNHKLRIIFKMNSNSNSNFHNSLKRNLLVKFHHKNNIMEIIIINNSNNNLIIIIIWIIIWINNNIITKM